MNHPHSRTHQEWLDFGYCSDASPPDWNSKSYVRESFAEGLEDEIDALKAENALLLAERNMLRDKLMAMARDNEPPDRGYF